MIYLNDISLRVDHFRARKEKGCLVTVNVTGILNTNDLKCDE